MGVVKRYIGMDRIAMKLNDLKADLAKRILESEDKEVLGIVKDVLSGRSKLSAAQKAELDRDWADHKAGKGTNHTWSAVKANARKCARG